MAQWPDRRRDRASNLLLGTGNMYPLQLRRVLQLVLFETLSQLKYCIRKFLIISYFTCAKTSVAGCDANYTEFIAVVHVRTIV